MFILLGYLSLTLVQLYHQYQRRRLYSNIMLRVLRNGSLLVQRWKFLQHSSVSTWLDSPTASCSRKSMRETQLPCDEALALSVICPRQAVDLSTWTSYLDIHPVQDGTGIIALLEAGRPDNVEAFRAASMKVPQAKQVHVLKHGCPLAWKAGSPFGIILHCSYNDFVVLCDAFGQGVLTLDGDLELYRILTVSTIGKPKSLQQPNSDMITITTDRGDSALTVGPPPPDSTLLLAKASSSPVAVTKALSSPVAVTKASSSPVAVAKASSSPVAATKASSSPVAAMESSSSPVAITMADSTTVTSGRDVSVTGLDKPLAVKSGVSVCNSSPVGYALNGSVSGAVSASNGADDKKLLTEADKQLNVTNGQVSENGNASQSVSGKKPTSTSDNGVQEAAGCKSLDENTSQQASSNGSAVFIQDGNAVPDSSPQSSMGTHNSSDNQGKSASQASVSDGLDQKTNGCKKTSNGEAVQAKSLTATKSPVSPRLSDSSPRKTLDTAASPSESPATPQSAASSTGKASESKLSPSRSASSPARGADDVNGTSKDKKFMKPPNVVVYCGIKDSTRKFEIIKTGLEQCLNMDAYTVYLLPHDEFMSMPWEDNAEILIISHDFLHDNISKKCTDYLLNGGKVISFSSSMEAQFVVRKEIQKRPMVAKFGLEKWRDVAAVQGCYHYVRSTLKKDNSSMEALVVDPKTGDPLVVQLMLSAEHGNGRAIFSQLLLERDPTEMAVDSKSFSSLKQSNKERLQVFRHLLSLLDLDTSVTPHPALTPCYILAEDKSLIKSLMDIISQRMNKDVIRSRNFSLRFVSAKSDASALKATNDMLPVITDTTLASGDGQPGIHFDPKIYWDHLTSSVMGRVVFYTDIIYTTMNVFEGIQFSIPEKMGLIAVAGRQTGGKGRGGNAWLSPVGCAMFTLPLQVSAESPLGQRMTYVQHIASLAVVHSIRSIPGYEDLDLRLKWPNDIYYGNHMKLGGVLVQSTIMSSTVHATIGCGVNVSNSQPTICINDVIQQHNRDHHANLSPLASSEVIARTVSAMETVIAQFQAKGHEDFCQLYYKYWLHSGAHVKVESEGNAEVDICGLDDFGFLRVTNKQGQQLSVQPDGNSFDMLRNLIAIKRD